MDIKDFPTYKAGTMIGMVYPPIFFTFGVIGNVLSIIVLCMHKNRKTSTAVLLTGLAVVDTMVLVIALPEKWLSTVSNYNVRTTSIAVCKLHVFLTYLLLQLSPWILIAITIERVCCVRYPNSVKDIFTRKRSIHVLIAIFLVLCACNSHLMYGFETYFIKEMNVTICAPKEDYNYFMFFVWPWIDFGLAFATPCLILIGGNMLIYTRLKGSVLFVRSLDGKCITDQTDKAPMSKTTAYVTRSKESVSKKSLDHQRTYSRTSTHSRTPSTATRRTSREAKHSFFTLTMFILNISFIVCVSPFNILAIGQSYWYSQPISPEQFAELYLISRVCFMLMYFNNVVNFFLYILLGPRFRRDVLQMFKCLKNNILSAMFSDKERDDNSDQCSQSLRQTRAIGNMTHNLAYEKEQTHISTVAEINSDNESGSGDDAVFTASQFPALEETTLHDPFLTNANGQASRV